MGEMRPPGRRAPHARAPRGTRCHRGDQPALPGRPSPGHNSPERGRGSRRVPGRPSGAYLTPERAGRPRWTRLEELRVLAAETRAPSGQEGGGRGGGRPLYTTPASRWGRAPTARTSGRRCGPADGRSGGGEGAKGPGAESEGGGVRRGGVRGGRWNGGCRGGGMKIGRAHV